MEIARYTAESQNTRVIEGKLACVKKGIAFCKVQLVSVATSFKTALSGSSFEESLDIQDGENEEEDDDAVEDDVDTGAISDDERVDIDRPTTGEDLEVTGENLPHSNLMAWKFPLEISQSTLNGLNGSYACSVIALIFAHEVHHQRLDLQPVRLLSPLWVVLMCAGIRIGNRFYDSCRHSLPQRFLSAAEAATTVERSVSASVDLPLPVRVFDEHAPTTLLFQLRKLCTNNHGHAALLIANEKTVLFMPIGNSSIALVDTHQHGLYGAEVLLGQRDSLDQFVHASQTMLGLQDDTYANISSITF